MRALHIIVERELDIYDLIDKHLVVQAPKHLRTKNAKYRSCPAVFIEPNDVIIYLGRVYKQQVADSLLLKLIWHH